MYDFNHIKPGLAGNAISTLGCFLRRYAVAATRNPPLTAPRAAILLARWLLFPILGTARRWKLRNKAMIIACVLMRSPTTAGIGCLLFARIMVKGEGEWGDIVGDTLAGVSDAMLVRYVLPEAVEVLAESDPERAKALLREAVSPRAWRRVERRLSSRRRLSLAVAIAYLGFEDGFSRFTSGLRGGQADILKRLFAEQKHAARKLGVGADYLSLRKAALKTNRAGPGAKRPKREGSEPIRIGLFDYRSPIHSSENLGDFVQTLGVVGQLSRFTFDKLTASEAVRDLLSQGRKVAPEARKSGFNGEAVRAVDGTVEIVPVNRDFPVTVAADGSIWLPVCGRFGVRAYPDRFDFPFPGNVRPLFMAFHIADPELLDTESLVYLRRFEPIGCRDLFTARLLRGAGVKAFFNGCVTMTLDRLRPPHDGARAGRYDTDKTGAFIDKGFTQSRHGDPVCLARDFDGNLRTGLALLDRYRAAEEVRADRLNAWLPCRAMGVPVTLKTAEEVGRGIDRADPRLDGLADLDDQAFRETALRFEAIVQPVLAAVLEGRSEAEVYALWREVCAPAMARTDAMIAERNAQYPLPKVSLESLGLGRAGGAQKGDHIPAQTFEAKRDPGSDEVHLLFAFDDKLAEHFPGTLEGVWRHASRPLTVHVFGRGLNTAMFERWAAQFDGIRFIRRDLSGFAYEDDSRFGRYRAVSALDYLLAPELLPDVEKVVYLDVDVLVRKDIAELFDIDLGNAPLAARNNVAHTFINGARIPYPHYSTSNMPAEKIQAFWNAFFSGGATVFERFNSGVLVMNLAKMRGERFVEKTIALIKSCGIDSDEIVLNCAVRERRKPLLRGWNHCPFYERMNDPAVVHFITAAKPWLSNPPFPFREEWRKNAQRARSRLSA